MALSDVRATVTGAKVQKGPKCGVCRALNSLGEDDAAILTELLADPKVTYSSLSDALRYDPDTPINVSDKALARHARGLCAARTKLRDES